MGIFDFIKRHKVFSFVVVVLVAFNILFFYFSPQEIVDAIGVTNSYLVTFLIAAIGGVSTLTGAALYASIATFAAGGADPLLLGLSGGVGIFISNSVFFLLAFYGRRSLSGHIHERLQRWTYWVEARVSRTTVRILSLVYLGASPFPDDVLMVALAAAGYRYRDVAPLLFVGGFSIALITAYLGQIWQFF